MPDIMDDHDCTHDTPAPERRRWSTLSIGVSIGALATLALGWFWTLLLP